MKEKLENIINDKTSNIDKNAYTEESYNAYLNVLEKAQAILKDPNASKEDITKALADLVVAYKGLQKSEVVVHDTNTPETADQANVSLYTSVIVISGLALAVLALKKNKTNLIK